MYTHLVESFPPSGGVFTDGTTFELIATSLREREIRPKKKIQNINVQQTFCLARSSSLSFTDFCCFSCNCNSFLISSSNLLFSISCSCWIRIFSSCSSFCAFSFAFSCSRFRESKCCFCWSSLSCVSSRTRFCSSSATLRSFWRLSSSNLHF